MENKQKRASGVRPKKRRFRGNKYTTVSVAPFNSCTQNEEMTNVTSVPDLVSESDPDLVAASAPGLVSTSASKKKLGDIASTSDSYSGTGNIIIDKQLLFTFLEQNVSCKLCHSDVKIIERKVIGLSSVISIICDNCHMEVSTRNSKLLGARKNIPEINRRIVYAMRCIGQGLESLKTFCGIMNFDSPISQKPYDKICRKINSASKSVAEFSMKKAANEEVEGCNSTDITVSGDGTWKTRGHTSQIGVCTVIGAHSGKVLDMEILSTACKGCDTWKGSASEFEEWNVKHSAVCTKNHIGSSGKMEADGMVTIFQRSERERGVRYVHYIGDGDSKTFHSISEAKPYENVVVTKLECIGHIQKRMGTRLRKLKKEYSSKKLSDGKSISGKGRLTDAVINKFATYFGKAIRENCNSIDGMRRAIWAIYFHTRSSDSEPLHSFCPPGLSSWCKYNKAVENNSLQLFKHKKTLPPAVMDAIKPVFNALSHPTLLTRCLGAFTQNANESLNSVIWQICPKTSGSGRLVAEIAAYEACVLFNEGRKGRLKIMQKLDLSISMHAALAQQNADKKRICFAERRAEENTADARRAKRQYKLCRNLKLSQNEGNMYEPGGF